MASSFSDKLLKLYFGNCQNYSRSRFRAFCILLRGIKFTPSEEFRNSILRFVIKRYRRDYESLFLGIGVETISRAHYRLEYEDLDFIFMSLLYLKTNISISLMEAICDQIEIKEHELYLKSLFISFFNTLKVGKMNYVAKMSLHKQFDYFWKHAVIPSENMQKVAKEKFGPRITSNDSWWGEEAPIRIKNIPMGGLNKRY